MSGLLKNVWGPAYAGVGGRMKKMWEMVVHPGHYPFMVGAVSSFLVISAIPVSGTNTNDSPNTADEGSGRGKEGRRDGLRGRMQERAHGGAVLASLPLLNGRSVSCAP